MKKLFVLMAAAFAMVACQTDINEVGVAGGEVDVTFEVGTPTRAYSDGTTATVLQYAVYEGETELTALTRSIENGNPDAISISKTVSFKLVTGNTYTVIFWAAAPNAPYTVDFVNKKMTVDYTAATTLSNDENRDAFYKRHTFTVTGAQTETIELRRPFAQLNIGTSDYTASANAGYTPDQSYVKVTKLGDVLNLWNDKVEGTDAVITFDYAAIPTTETFPVTGYEYLAMNYLLVDSEKEVVDIEFAYKETSTGDAKTRVVGSVPVQRNYRTNIYGQLLTSDVDIVVEIKPEYEEPDNNVPGKDLDILINAAQNGGVITLNESVILKNVLDVQKNLTINLNGKTISGAFTKGGDGANAMIKNNATLTIVGGTIKNTTENGDAAIYNTGNLVLDGVKIEGAPIGTTGYPEYAVYSVGGTVVVEEGTEIVSDRGAIRLENGADVTINGGKFTVTDAVGSRVLTAHVIYAKGSASKLTINGGDFAQNIANGGGTSVICPAGATIKVYGGNFYHVPVTNFDSKIFQNYMGYGAPVDVYGGTYNDDSVTKSGNLADGYKAIEKNGLYYVVANDVDTVVADATELQAALAAGGEIVLAGDVTYAQKIENDAVIDLNGNSFLPAGTITLGNNADLTMVGGDYVVNGTYGHVDVRPSTADGSVVVYENVNFAYNKLSNTYGPSTNRLGSVVEVCATVAGAKTVIKFKDCTFDNAMVVIEGMSDKTGIVEAVFERCTFNALTSSAPIYVQNYVTGTIEVKDCTFNLECTSGVASAISVSPSSSTSVVLTATNNTLNAVAATPYTYDASKGETEAHNVKVNGTPANIKFISAYANTTVTETGTVKSGIAML